jgi:hypothetical protein
MGKGGCAWPAVDALTAMVAAAHKERRGKAQQAHTWVRVDGLPGAPGCCACLAALCGEAVGVRTSSLPTTLKEAEGGSGTIGAVVAATATVADKG